MALGPDARVEVVNGEIVTMPPVGMQHAFVVNNVYSALAGHVTANGLGYVFSDGLIYILSAEPEGVRGARVPDVSFVKQGRIAQGMDLRRPFPGPPDLAVEVVSPGEGAADVLGKLRNYLGAGAAQVWVLYPDQREVHQYLRGEPVVRVYTGEEPIDAGGLLPELRLTPADVAQRG